MISETMGGDHEGEEYNLQWFQTNRIQQQCKYKYKTIVNAKELLFGYLIKMDLKHSHLIDEDTSLHWLSFLKHGFLSNIQRATQNLYVGSSCVLLHWQDFLAEGHREKRPRLT